MTLFYPYDTFTRQFMEEFIPDQIRAELRNKCGAGCASGILNAPDANYDPAIDEHIPHNYSPADHPDWETTNWLWHSSVAGICCSSSWNRFTPAEAC